MIGTEIVDVVLAKHGTTQEHSLFGASICALVALLNFLYLRRVTRFRELASAKALLLFAAIGSFFFPMGTLLGVATLYIGTKCISKA